MTEYENKEVQAVVDGAQSAANELSLAGKHVLAARVASLIQVTRVMWTRLQPPPKEEAVPELAAVPPGD